MLRQAHLKLIAGHSVRHGIRGGAGLISIFMTLATGLILANVVIAPLEMVDREQARITENYGDVGEARMAEIRTETNAAVIKTARKVIDWAVSPSEKQLDYVTKDKPAIVSAFLMLLMLFTPFLICLGGFNQTSTDIDTKGLRFLLIRTERANIFIGRFIGTYLFTAGVFAILFAILALYMGVKLTVHPTSDMVLWLLEGYLRVMIFALPYMAVCAWVSSAIESGFGSLIIGMMLVYFIPALIGAGANINKNISYLQFATPWGFKWWLFQPIGLQFFGGVVAMVGFTALFLWAGGRYFGKRDL